MISIKFQVKVNKRGDTPEKRHFYDSIIGSHQAEDEEVDDDGYVPDNFIFPYVFACMAHGLFAEEEG